MEAGWSPPLPAQGMTPRPEQQAQPRQQPRDPQGSRGRSPARQQCPMCFPSWSPSTLPDPTRAVEAGPCRYPGGGGQAEGDTCVLAGFKGTLPGSSYHSNSRRGGRPAPNCFLRKAPRPWWAALATRAVLGSWFLSQTAPFLPLPPYPALSYRPVFILPVKQGKSMATVPEPARRQSRTSLRGPCHLPLTPRFIWVKQNQPKSTCEQ